MTILKYFDYAMSQIKTKFYSMLSIKTEIYKFNKNLAIYHLVKNVLQKNYAVPTYIYF